MDIRVAGIVEESFVDGPGVRYTIFTQGCAHKCKGCHNPQTHSFNGGELVDIDTIIGEIKADKLISGVTLSGGDPLYQLESIKYLCKKLKDNNINIWCYTGFTFEDIQRDIKMSEILQYIDVLVDGEYMQEKRDLSLRFRGSSNQRIIDVQRSIEAGYTVIIDME